MKCMKSVKLSQFYTKFKELKEGKAMTLIRRSSRSFELGETIIVKYGDDSIYTELVEIQRIIFDQIPEEILLKDTSPYANNIIEARAHIRSRYNKDILDNDELFVFYLEKSKQFS